MTKRRMARWAVRLFLGADGVQYTIPRGTVVPRVYYREAIYVGKKRTVQGQIHQRGQ